MKILPTTIKSLSIATLGLASLSTLAATTATPASNFSTDQKQQIEQIVHDYLVTKPEVLIEASKALQEKQQEKAASKAKEAIAKNATALFDGSKAPILGNPKGDVTIVEFLDYQCGHCKTMGPVITEVVKADPNVRVIIRGLPIFGEASKTATKAVIASTQQGAEKFTKFNEALLASTDRLNEKNIMDIAKKAGLDTTKLKKDMASKAVEDQMQENFRLAREIGLMGTPAFIIGNHDASKTEFLPGAVSKEDLSSNIAKLRG